jgi:hypothetical protein
LQDMYAWRAPYSTRATAVLVPTKRRKRTTIRDKGRLKTKVSVVRDGQKKNGAFLGRRSVRTQSVAFKISSDDAHVRGLVRARDDRHGDDCANHDYDRAGRGDDDPSDESGHANGGDDHRCRCVPRWRPQALSTQQ